MKTAWQDARRGAQGRRAGVADRLGVRAGAGRAPHADAAAAHRSRRHAPAADRSRRGPQPARRLVPRAGVRAARRRRARLRRSAALLRAFFAAIARLRRAGLVLAYHDRSDGGAVRHARRDGVRRALRHSTIELPAADVPGAVARRSSRRNSARSCRSRPRAVERSARSARATRGSTTACATSAGRRRGSRARSRAARAPCCCRRRAPSCAARGPRRAYRMQALRDNPACADEECAAGRRSRRIRACLRA